MPELPEVETMRRSVLRVCGSRVASVFRFACRKRQIAASPNVATISRRIRNSIIADVERLGKRVVLRMDDGQRLVFEPRMTGLVLLDQPPTQEHLRIGVRLVGANRESLVLKFWDRRGLGQVALYTEDEFQRQFDDQRIGPDALAVSARVLRARLGASASPVKVALLDQRKIAGVGNLYASEILHRAGVNPRTRCRELSANQWTRVHYQLRRVLRAAIRHEGSTLADGTYRNALNEAAGYQHHHCVYDRAGEQCATCRRGIVVRIVQAQRATFYCPRCQA